MSRRPTLPAGFHLWSESLRRKWVDEYNAKLPELNEEIARKNAVCIQRKEEDFRRFRNIATPEGYQWFNTETNPCKPATGFDAGRTAWKFHAVQAGTIKTFSELGNRKAACGVTPYYGWTLDLFMDENDSVAGKCLRCLKKIAGEPNERT